MLEFFASESAMFSEPIPPYSIPPLVGLVTNATLLLIGLGALALRRSYLALAQILVFYATLVLFFLGYSFYALQHSPASILFWYRIMLAGLACMPIGQTWFARRLLPGLPRWLAWSLTGLSLLLALAALFLEGPWTLDDELELHSGRTGILRPSSLLLRPAIYGYALFYCLALLLAVAAEARRTLSFRRLPLVLYGVGLLLWSLSGVNDIMFSLNLPAPVDGTVLWLGSLGLSMALAMTVAVIQGGLERSVRRARDVFERFVPATYLKRIASQGLGSIRLGQAARQEAVILYSDIRGFTTLADQLSPAELVAFLNLYFEAMTREVSREEGVVDRYIGDAVLCVFEGAQAAARAVRCGVNMLRAAARVASPQGQGLNIGIGIHRGEVILGTVGSVERMDSTVIGLAVNLAARLEQATKLTGAALLLSAAVIEELPPDHGHSLRLLGDFQLPGIAHAVEVWEVYDLDPAQLRTLKDQAARLTLAAREQARQGGAEQARQLLLEAQAVAPSSVFLPQLEAILARLAGS